MTLYEILKYFNIAMGVLFLVCYSYQLLFLLLGTVIPPPKYEKAEEYRRFAFCIAARNEEAVICQLCESIRKQNYPSELLDIYVVADNCTDATAKVARKCGAVVFERFDSAAVGKGYALSFLFDELEKSVGISSYDGYFVVDADNILDKNYVSAMNDCACAGYRAAMCYRNSKNYADNWISAGYSLWFLRASRHLNSPRHFFGLSCEITGTGFYVCSDILKKNGGWSQHCLIEDIEFTMDCVLRGERVAFCYDAIVYDEQPTGLAQSVKQRIRWCRGYFQVIRKYGARLLGRFFRGEGFSNFDMIMGIAAAFFISAIFVAVNVIFAILIFIFDAARIPSFLRLEAVCVISAYLLMFLAGILAGACERKRIKAPTRKVVLYYFTFPIFVATFIPISIIALFSRAEWEPIEHHAADISKFEDM